MRILAWSKNRTCIKTLQVFHNGLYIIQAWPPSLPIPLPAARWETWTLTALPLRPKLSLFTNYSNLAWLQRDSNSHGSKTTTAWTQLGFQFQHVILKTDRIRTCDLWGKALETLAINLYATDSYQRQESNLQQNQHEWFTQPLSFVS